MAPEKTQPASEKCCDLENPPDMEKKFPKTLVVFCCGHSKLESHKVYHNFDWNPPLDLPSGNGMVDVQPVRISCLHRNCRDTPVDHNALQGAVTYFRSALTNMQNEAVLCDKELIKTRKGVESMPTHAIGKELRVALQHIKLVQKWVVDSTQKPLLPGECMDFSHSFIAAIDRLEDTSSRLWKVAEIISHRMPQNEDDKSGKARESNGNRDDDGRNIQPNTHTARPEFPGSLRITPVYTLQDSVRDLEPTGPSYTNYYPRHISHVQGYAGSPAACVAVPQLLSTTTSTSMAESPQHPIVAFPAAQHQGYVGPPAAFVAVPQPPSTTTSSSMAELPQHPIVALPPAQIQPTMTFLLPLNPLASAFTPTADSALVNILPETNVARTCPIRHWKRSGGWRSRGTSGVTSRGDARTRGSGSRSTPKSGKGRETSQDNP